MLRITGETRSVAAVSLLAVLAAAPSATRDVVASEGQAAASCVLSSIEVAVDGADTVVELSITGNPASFGARLEEGRHVVLDLAGCVPAPGATESRFDHGLVASLTLAERSGAEGPLAEVTVETRQPFDYVVRSADGVVGVRLLPLSTDGGAAPSPVAGPEPAAGSLLWVMEPLPIAPAAPLLPEPSAEPSAAADTPEASTEDEVAAQVARWARAWSDQQVEDYLATYAPAFTPPRGASREAWEAQRRQRLTAPRFIEVSLDGLEVRLVASGRAAASFWQSYDSDRYSDRVYKTQTWIRVGDGWKISDEKVVTPPGS